MVVGLPETSYCGWREHGLVIDKETKLGVLIASGI